MYVCICVTSKSIHGYKSHHLRYTFTNLMYLNCVNLQLFAEKTKAKTEMKNKEIRRPYEK